MAMVGTVAAQNNQRLVIMIKPQEQETPLKWFHLTGVNPLTTGAVNIRVFLHFILAHYISDFKPGKDKK